MVLDDEGTKLDSWRPLHDNGFTLPLSRSYIETHFGTGAIQIPSGESVVIMGNNLVYKYPLHPLDWCTLAVLGKRKPKAVHSIKQSVWPLCTYAVGTSDFFKYPLYNKPLTLSTAQAVLPQLVQSVCNAISELHTIGYAHLDVRLANICFDNGRRAMLIDLDRSKPTIVECTGLYMQYGRSVIYKTPLEEPDWTVDKLDWRQLGLMICSIMDGCHGAEYHSYEPKVPTGSYLFKLLSEGENREDLFGEWESSLHTSM